jgi:iron complex outermembrane receptor protein
MSVRSFRWGESIPVGTMLLAAASVVAAADSGNDSAGGLEEVIVTAERQARSLQKTPVAVGVLSADDLAGNGVKRLWDANGAVPGLYMSSYPSNMQYISIRGIGTADPGVFAPVGYYLDDVYLGRTFGRGSILLPDIERVEVLRGPQGTLYGQNTTGGAIKFISRDPSFTSPGNWVSASLGNFGQEELLAYLSAPLGDTVGVSIAYAHRQTDGDHYNAYRDERVNRQKIDQFRAKVRWKPVEDLDVVLAVDGTHDDSDNYIPTPHNVPGGGVPRVVYANTDTQMHRSDLGQTLRAEYAISEQLTLRSITAHRRDRNDPHPWDTDGGPTDVFGWNQKFTEKVRSQELQLVAGYERLSFTVGANYYDESFDFDRLQWLNLAYTNLEAHLTYRNWALYGQGNYRITPNLGVTLGVRYNSEKQRFAAESYVSNAARERISLNYVVSGLEQEDSALTPKIGLDYQWTPNVFSYVSYTKGEKSGGFNRAAGTLAVASVPVASEKVTAYEVGVKSRLFGGSLDANVAAFYNDFKDYQANVTNPVINGRTVNGNVVANAGSAHTYGLEVDLTARPLARLEARLAGSLLRTKFDEFINPTGAASSDFTGNEVPNAPHYTGALRLNYDVPLAKLPGSLRVNGSVNYVASHFTDIANTRATRTDSQTYVDAGAEYTNADARWSLGVLVKNALDKDYVLSRGINALLGTDTSSYNPPRTWAATFRYHFN